MKLYGSELNLTTRILPVDNRQPTHPTHGDSRVSPGAVIEEVMGGGEGTPSITPIINQPRMASLAFSTEPVSGQIFLDRVALGSTPVGIEMMKQVPAGSHKIEFGAVTGYITPAEKFVNLLPGEYQRVVGTYVVVGAIPPPAPPTPTPPGPTPTPIPTPTYYLRVFTTQLVDGSPIGVGGGHYTILKDGVVVLIGLDLLYNFKIAPPIAGHKYLLGQGDYVVHPTGATKTGSNQIWIAPPDVPIHLYSNQDVTLKWNLAK